MIMSKVAQNSPVTVANFIALCPQRDFDVRALTDRPSWEKQHEAYMNNG